MTDTQRGYLMGENIKRIRENKGLTRAELAQKSNITRATIWRIETHPGYVTTTETLLKLAKALDVDASEFFVQAK